MTEIHTETITDDTGRQTKVEIAMLDDGGWHWRPAGTIAWDGSAYYTRESALEAAKVGMTT